MTKIIFLFALLFVAHSVPQFYKDMKDNFGIQTFNLNGDWQFLDTTCTDLPQCKPILKIVQIASQIPQVQEKVQENKPEGEQQPKVTDQQKEQLQ